MAHQTHEYKDGYQARFSNVPLKKNPWHWSWHYEEWEKGWKEADAIINVSHGDDDDDDHGSSGKGPGGWPSTTGNPSGGGRDNGPRR